MPKPTTVKMYNPWGNRKDEGRPNYTLQVSCVAKPRTEEYAEEDDGLELVRLTMNNPFSVQWFPFPPDFIRREAYTKPDMLMEVSLLEPIEGDRFEFRPKDLPLGAPGTPFRFAASEIDLAFYRDGKAILPAKPWKIPVLYKDKELSEADQRYNLEFGIEDLLQDCADFLFDGRPAEPQLALAKFLFKQHEEDRLMEEIEQARLERKEEERIRALEGVDPLALEGGELVDGVAADSQERPPEGEQAASSSAKVARIASKERSDEAAPAVMPRDGPLPSALKQGVALPAEAAADAGSKSQHLEEGAAPVVDGEAEDRPPQAALPREHEVIDEATPKHEVPPNEGEEKTAALAEEEDTTVSGDPARTEQEHVEEVVANADAPGMEAADAASDEIPKIIVVAPEDEPSPASASDPPAPAGVGSDPAPQGSNDSMEPVEGGGDEAAGQNGEGDEEPEKTQEDEAAEAG
ncbi:unnamed protein product [Amoebophrya sp. A25]|nr:unnamed protein product [Amoebophrya sp. A25]|eukprot:GSA25T00024088001.1